MLCWPLMDHPKRWKHFWMLYAPKNSNGSICCDCVQCMVLFSLWNFVVDTRCSQRQNKFSIVNVVRSRISTVVWSDGRACARACASALEARDTLMMMTSMWTRSCIHMSMSMYVIRCCIIASTQSSDICNVHACTHWNGANLKSKICQS